jgi:hypothetical protein
MKEYLIKIEEYTINSEVKEEYNIYFYENGDIVSKFFYGNDLNNPQTEIPFGYKKHIDSL